ncbi:hypothetical protein F5Y04DRAFT_278355 [Hypomontagnella monticulosa]|nr:hypothetical protein F5Y04DRAFT_278355 [Hypomontagnella monticulosa]
MASLSLEVLERQDSPVPWYERTVSMELERFDPSRLIKPLAATPMTSKDRPHNLPVNDEDSDEGIHGNYANNQGNRNAIRQTGSCNHGRNTGDQNQILQSSDRGNFIVAFLVLIMVFVWWFWQLRTYK